MAGECERSWLLINEINQAIVRTLNNGVEELISEMYDQLDPTGHSTRSPSCSSHHVWPGVRGSGWEADLHPPSLLPRPRRVGTAGRWLLLVRKAKDKKDTGRLSTHQ